MFIFDIHTRKQSGKDEKQEFFLSSTRKCPVIEGVGTGYNNENLAEYMCCLWLWILHDWCWQKSHSESCTAVIEFALIIKFSYVFKWMSKGTVICFWMFLLQWLYLESSPRSFHLLFIFAFLNANFFSFHIDLVIFTSSGLFFCKLLNEILAFKECSKGQITIRNAWDSISQASGMEQVWIY